MVTHQSYVSLAHFLLQVSPFSRQLVSISLPISQERKARCQEVWGFAYTNKKEEPLDHNMALILTRGKM